jgi:transcriptional regulator with XRE-family HTH domain
MYTNLKLQIWKSGMRQNRLAQTLGMHETVLSKIVNGFRKPSSSIRARIAAVLHSDETWLFHWDDDVVDGGPVAAPEHAAEPTRDSGGLQ